VVGDRRIAVDGNADLAVDYFEAEILSARDFYPFGMVMPERSFSTQAYRYGFNGKEFDSEWRGGKNSYDFGARCYDPRLGRFLSIDPLVVEFPSLTPYNFAGNNPIAFIDAFGEGPILVVKSITFAGRSKDGTPIYKVTASIDISVKVMVLAKGKDQYSFPSILQLTQLIDSKYSRSLKGKRSITFDDNFDHHGDLTGSKNIQYDITIEKVDVHIDYIENLAQVGKEDILLLIIDKIGPTNEGSKDPLNPPLKDPAGYASSSIQMATIEGQNFKISERTTWHELGHVFGLPHVAHSSINLMSYAGGKNLSSEQYNSILEVAMKGWITRHRMSRCVDMRGGEIRDLDGNLLLKGKTLKKVVQDFLNENKTDYDEEKLK
jgi:RHS repeat-associated protein